MSTKREKEKRRERWGFLAFVFDIYDIIEIAIALLPGKALTALVIVGAVSGAVGYDSGVSAGIGVGVDSVNIPECPTCPEQIVCPEPEPCPVCKELSDYTDDELVEALKPTWVCFKEEIETGGQ